MPALADRDRFESAIVMALTPIFREQYERAINAPGPAQIPYAQFQADLTHAMDDQLFQVFTAAGYALIIGQALVVSPGAFEESARQWCQRVSGEMAENVVSTSQRMTGELANLSRNDPQRFREGLQVVYLSPARLNAIAITEVTRASSYAEHAVVFFFRQDKSLRLIPVWITVEVAPGVPAASVCPICEPFDRHGPEVYGGEFPFGPPAHTGCRCHRDWWDAAEFSRRAA